MSMIADSPPDDLDALDPRSRIVAAGVRLVAERGARAATTRAIATAASVQAPTIFRHFGDKNGLLDAVAARTMAEFLKGKVKVGATDDPVRDLETGMKAFMEFGIGNPDVFIHMYGRRGERSEAFEAGHAALRERVRRVATAGRLRVTEERACDVLQAMARGTVFEMFDRPASNHGEMIRAAANVALHAVVLGRKTGLDGDIEACASALRAQLDGAVQMTPGERLLMSELLGRMADRE